jgi:integrase
MKYRLNGKENKISLGLYPETTLKEARERRDAQRKLLGNGIDPSYHRKTERAVQADRAANSFEQVARKWFAKNSPSWAPGHAARKIRLFERDIFPWIGRQPIAEIKPPELLSVLRRIEKRGTLDTARRAHFYCGQVFRFAVAEGCAESDPSRDLRGALSPVQAGNFAAITVPDELAPILRAFDDYRGVMPQVSAALRLMPMVFVRPGELRKAEWSQINLDKAEWWYRLSKKKKWAEKVPGKEPDHVVPLSRQAVEILRDLYPLTGHGKYVFPNPKSSARPMSDNAVLVAMRTMGITKDVTCGHGFRATSRTLLDEKLGYRVDLIEHQLGHAVKDPNGRAYNRTSFLPERKRMMQDWADYLDALKDGEGEAFLRSHHRKRGVKVLPFTA